MLDILIPVAILSNIGLMGYGLYVMGKRCEKRREAFVEGLRRLMDEAEERGEQL